MLGCRCRDDKAPRRPHLYVASPLVEFREEVVKSILREMLEERGKKIMEIGVAHVIDEIEYDVTEDIKEYQLALKFYKKSTAVYQ